MGKVKKSHGNMYDWVTHMWSPSVGCPHQCSYCYVTQHKALPEEVVMDKPYPNLGMGRTIFVGFECDLFAEGVSDDDIRSVLTHCNVYPNKYVFQSKNPARIASFAPYLPKHSLIGTTIETDDARMLNGISKAPTPMQRSDGLNEVWRKGFDTFVTIEPILDFNVDRLLHLVVAPEPTFINIGADSKGHGLSEPSKEKILELVDGIRKANIEIRKKMNLERILNDA